jgi:hypothetical protein
MKSPFKFLDAYELEDKDYFFGRKEEVDALYNMIFKSPLLLVYGLSGTGKTSLIQCGLASRFSGPNWLPFKIRRGKNINDSIGLTLTKAFPKGETPEGNLLGNVSFLYDYYLRPVYLIFDQFEELFILGDEEEQQQFARSIRMLIESNTPCKVILVMREEFHGQLYYLEKEIPSIYDHRLRVEPMGVKKIAEVIHGSFEKFNISLEDPEKSLKLMYENISGKKSGIQLPYLQVYLDMLWKEDFVRTYPEESTPKAFPPYPRLRFTIQEIENFGKIEDVLARFLQEQEGRLRKLMVERFPNVVDISVRNILDAFVTEEGTKRPMLFHREQERIVLEESVRQYMPKTPEGLIGLVLEELESSRILRERDGQLELAHDSLAALIDKGRSDYQRNLNEQYTRLLITFRAFVKEKDPEKREYLSPGQVALLKDFPELDERLDDQLRQFIADSEINAQLELEKERKMRKEAEENAEKAQKAQKKAKRNSLLAFRVGIIAVITALVSVYLFWNTRQTLDQLQKETAAKEAAEVQKAKVEAIGLTQSARIHFEAGNDSLAMVIIQKALQMDSTNIEAVNLFEQIINK